MRKRLPVRETFTYPRVTVTSDHNPCHDNISTYEHVLDCGHLITTAEPDEPCAPNCHPGTQTNWRSTSKMSLSRALEKDFYCDACVEEQADRVIDAGDSSKHAERTRTNYRRHEARSRDKANSFRKCYIAQKIVSVPCDEDGDTVSDYDPYVSAHPFDTSWPPTGDNMFEDVDATVIKPQPDIKESQSEGQSSRDGATTCIDEAVAEDVNETTTEGPRWLREEKERERRRAEEATTATQRTRAAARPVILSSSPIAGLWDSASLNRSARRAQTNTTDDSSPIIPKKKQDRTMKVASEAASTIQSIDPSKRQKPTLKTPKRKITTPKTPTPDSDKSRSTLNGPSRRTTQTGSSPNSHTGPAKKVRKTPRKRAADHDAPTEPTEQSTKRAKVTPEVSSLTQAAAAAAAHVSREPATLGEKRKSASKSGPATKSSKKSSKRVCTVL